MTKKKKSNIDHTTQIMIFKATRKPINLSIKTYLIKYLSIFVVLFISVFAWLLNNYIQQSRVMIEKDYFIASLLVENNDYQQENMMLYTMIELRDEIIVSKTAEIQEKLESLDKFKRYIEDYIGLSQGSASEYDYSASRSMIERDLFFQDQVKTEPLELENIELKLADFQSELSQKRAEYNELFKEVEKRIEYIESFPDFFPVVGRITSGFGYRTNPVTYRYEFHNGIDIANSHGTEIRAAGSGIVVSAEYAYLLGKHIVVDHGFGYISRYAHLHEYKVDVGEQVEKGQVIATMGSTGQSTGPHLHFEILIEGVPVNPKRISEYFN